MVEQTSSVSAPEHTQDTVPLLSALANWVTPRELYGDRLRLQSLIKANNALCDTVKASQYEEAIIDSLKSDWAKYKPLVIVGPSGAGKVSYEVLYSNRVL